MDAQKIIDIVGKVIQVASQFVPASTGGGLVGAAGDLVKTGTDMAPFAEMIYDHLINKKAISQKDLDALDAKLAAQSARIQAQLPPEQDDDI